MTHSDFNQLMSSIKGLSPDQMRLLRQRLDNELAQPKLPAAQGPGHAKPGRSKRPLTEAEFQHHLLSMGLLTSLPDPTLDIDDDDPDDVPVAIKGEPLSETIIRERR